MNTTPCESTGRWYVVRSKPKQEARAEANLRAWGVETFAPRLWQGDDPQRGATAPRTCPLFPGYLFAHFDMDAVLTKVRMTRGVHSVVGFGGGPTPVDDSIMGMIRSRVQDDGYVHVAAPAPGDVVEIVHGPLRTLVGVFERNMKASARALILLNSLTAPMHVQVPVAHVRKMAMPTP